LKANFFALITGSDRCWVTHTSPLIRPISLQKVMRYANYIQARKINL
jgi:hypothetical protein